MLTSCREEMNALRKAAGATTSAQKDTVRRSVGLLVYCATKPPSTGASISVM